MCVVRASWRRQDSEQILKGGNIGIVRGRGEGPHWRTHRGGNESGIFRSVK